MTNTASDGPRRGDIFFVDPFAIEIHRDLRDPPTSEIRSMAVSMHLHGQRRAVECSKVEGDRLRLDHGFIRTAAARLICSGFTYMDPESRQDVKIKDKRFKLKVAISNVGTETQGNEPEYRALKSKPDDTC